MNTPTDTTDYRALHAAQNEAAYARQQAEWAQNDRDIAERRAEEAKEAIAKAKARRTDLWVEVAFLVGCVVWAVLP